MHSDKGKNHSEEGYIVTPLCLVRFLKIGVLGDRKFPTPVQKKFWKLRKGRPGIECEDG